MSHKGRGEEPKVERGLSERECRGGAAGGGEHLLCIPLPESDGRRPEKDQSPEVREAGWQGLWITSPPPSKALEAPQDLHSSSF